MGGQPLIQEPEAEMPNLFPKNPVLGDYLVCTTRQTARENQEGNKSPGCVTYLSLLLRQVPGATEPLRPAAGERQSTIFCYFLIF